MIAALVSQWAQPEKLSDKTVDFWLVNVALVFMVYMLGMTGAEVPNKRGPLTFMWFFLVYLGPFRWAV